MKNDKNAKQTAPGSPETTSRIRLATPENAPELFSGGWRILSRPAANGAKPGEKPPLTGSVFLKAATDDSGRPESLPQKKPKKH